MVESDFLGKGWGFPVALGEPGVAQGHESIVQAIRIILSTSPGERVMRPDFGCGLHHLVFAPNDPRTSGRAAQEVREALVRWEPRIDVLDVQAQGEGEELLISVSYRVRSTNNFFNLVYPFYLGVDHFQQK
jgi:phage baseplate assembly protein W